MIDRLIVDTGPLVAVAHLTFLDLLPRISRRVEIPEAVYEECVVEPERPGARSIEKAVADGLLEVVPTPDSSESITPRIDLGERSVIAWAIETEGLAVLDEQDAREVARELGIRFTGSSGLLIVAKSRGLIDSVSSHLDELIDFGYYISEGLKRQVLETAGESDESGSLEP